MTEIYHDRDETIQSLLSLYVEAQENGFDGLSQEIWEKLLELDREQVNKKLTDLRQELNEG